MRKGIRESAKISADQRFLLHFLETEKHYGIRLPPELYAHLNPMPFEAAAQMKKDLAADLRQPSRLRGASFPAQAANCASIFSIWPGWYAPGTVRNAMFS